MTTRLMQSINGCVCDDGESIRSIQDRFNNYDFHPEVDSNPQVDAAIATLDDR